MILELFVLFIFNFQSTLLLCNRLLKSTFVLIIVHVKYNLLF